MMIRNAIINKRFVSIQTDGSSFVFGNSSSETNVVTTYIGRVDKGVFYIAANIHTEDTVNELKQHFNFTEVVPTNGSIKNERTFEKERTVI